MNIWGILGVAVTGLLFAIVQWVRAGQAQATGESVEAGKAAAVAATAQAAIAQAVTAAPATQLAVVDRLKAGTF